MIELPHPDYPMLSERMDTPFVADLLSGTTIYMNGQERNIAVYNIIIGTRDVRCYQLGLIPHKGWKITEFKRYYGLKGRKDKVFADFLALKAEVMG